MAQSTTPRLGLTTWSSDMDQHPGRPGTNTNHEKLDELVAVWAGKGLLSARPTPGVQGRFYVSTNSGDGGQLSVDLGDKWLEVSVLGGGGAPPTVDIGGQGSEGTSQRAMRSDARIGLPLATPNNHGAMPAQLADLIDSATSAASAWTVMYRDSGGRTRVGSPVDGNHAANKDYVDGSGTAAIVGGTIARRWASGHISGPEPDKPEFYATKRYVDSRTSREEWKTNVRPVPYGLEEVLGLSVKAWEYREDAPSAGKGFGPMVENVADVMPELAVVGDDGRPERVLDRDYIWVLTQAFQELATQHAKLWDIVAEHQAHLDQLDDDGEDG